MQATADISIKPIEHAKSGFDHSEDFTAIQPLAGLAVGMVNLCRIEPAPVRPADLSFLIDLGRPLAALIITSTLRRQLQRATQLLADRKVLDRAKGLIQEELGWSEAQAYTHIRR